MFEKYDSYTKVKFSLRLREILVTLNKLHVIPLTCTFRQILHTINVAYTGYVSIIWFGYRNCFGNWFCPCF